VIDETISINKMRYVDNHGLSFRGGGSGRNGTLSEFAEKYARTQG